MSTLPESAGEILPPNPIRIETALSRFPVHKLARSADIKKELHENVGSEATEIKWKVSYNSDYGQPGPLAYKLDTLIINRRIEEVSQPGRSTRKIPKIIKLGSIRGIISELGLKNHDTQLIKNSLHQNASAYITPKIRYQKADGTEETLETGFNRYSVVFTGDKLPNGRKADAVYIILNDIYMQVLNGAMTRPLDYDYIKCLSPASQRFYELLSFRMYATIKNDRLRAKLLYSELCTYAPLVRQADWNIVRPQLARIHAPHKKSGYIARIDFQDTVDSGGNPDWIMLYQPGPKARAEYKAFTKRGGPVMLEAEPISDDTPSALVASLNHVLPPAEPETPFMADLVKRGVTAKVAASLVQQYPADYLAGKIEQFDYEMAQPNPPKRPAGYLVKSIEKDYAPPKDFTTKAERQRLEDDRQTRKRQEAAERQRKQEEEAREKTERQAVRAYRKTLTADQLRDLDAKALASADEETRRNCETPGHRELNRLLRDSITDAYILRHRLWQLEEA